MIDDRPALGGIGRLARTGNTDRHAKPVSREPEPPLRQLDPLIRTDVGPADVAAADLDPMQGQMLAECLGLAVVASP